MDIDKVFEFAFKIKSKSLMKEAAKAGADIDSRKGWKLYEAVAHNRYNDVILLLECGANPRAGESDKEHSALSLAKDKAYGKTKYVSILEKYLK